MLVGQLNEMSFTIRLSASLKVSVASVKYVSSDCILSPAQGNIFVERSTLEEGNEKLHMRKREVMDNVLTCMAAIVDKRSLH